MNRKIEFRAWDEQQRVMYYNVERASVHSCGFPDFEGILNSDWAIMQYIGLKDKNGKEIYEGDILQLASKGANPCWEIAWYENGWHMKLIKRKPDHPENYYVRMSSERVTEFDEVIGNIHQNKELLNEH